MSSLNNLMELAIAQLPLAIAFTWKAAGEKHALYKAIDNVKDSHDRLIAALDKNLSLLAQESQSSRNSLEEKVAGQGKRFGAKFERLERKVDDVIDYKVILDRLDNLGK
ncbi:hypothetical protein FJR38_26900 [Anabaena sp. UHCC 0253]|uniref:hypothetical protein n=1 Tax=Anabaena sp. UHCC 0253 TaxID=2590019 RepID=UPI0014478DDC|nr:hypothetical protein [Anabaena sp. UHCC 0253]MTJ56019.1 hypothetical protein [Anabaena sp. UHCC 0253]